MTMCGCGKVDCVTCLLGINVSDRTGHTKIEGPMENKAKLIKWLAEREGGGQMTTTFRPNCRVDVVWRLELLMDGKTSTWLATTEDEVFARAVNGLVGNANDVIAKLASG